MTIDASLLVLIEGETDAYRLVATWPRIGREANLGDLRLLDWDEPRKAGVEVLVQSWSRYSGVDPDVIAHWAPILFGNLLLGEGGTVDEDVHNVVRAAGASRLRRGMGAS